MLLTTFVSCLMLGTVSLTMLYYLKQLTLLNHDLINFGNIKIWFMISKIPSKTSRNRKSQFTS